MAGGWNWKSRATHHETQKRRLEVWEMRHDPDCNLTMQQIADKVGVSRETAHKYVAELSVQFQRENSEARDLSISRTLAELHGIKDKALANLNVLLDDIDSNPKAINAQLAVYHKAIEDEAKWMGWDAAAKVDVTVTTFTPEELAAIAKNATPEERAQIRKGETTVAKAVLDRVGGQ